MKHLLLLSLLQVLTDRVCANPLPNLGGGDGGLPSLSDLLDGIIPGLFDPADGSGSDSGPGSSNPGSGTNPIPGSSPGSDYILTWADEFDAPQSTYDEYTSSSLPSSEHWRLLTGTSYPSGAPAWGNNELQSYTTDTSNIHITSESTLLITPRYSDSTSQWTSGRIETSRTDFAASEGGKLYIESRLRTGCAPTSQQAGIWPAFWALGETFRADPTHWPMASEWDLVEVINGQPTVYNTLHCGRETGEGGPCNEYTGLGSGGVAWNGCDWHVVGFEVDRSGSSLFSSASSAVSSSGSGSDSGFPGGGGGWAEETLTWYLDGQATHRVTGADVGDEEVWESIAHQGHFLLLNVAVGGNWPGYPDANTVDGEEVAMEVDYNLQGLSKVPAAAVAEA
ncbi:glycoside hydrolase family 16 protein [Aspergillus stella-maris]|uniref:glycoside hydrolase family 16 protein n=1 Tax=Aspergillus stella-maris TaxID=1810926 RepID=UPI003CCD30FA